MKRDRRGRGRARRQDVVRRRLRERRAAGESPAIRELRGLAGVPPARRARGDRDLDRDQGRIARFTVLGYRELLATMLAHGDPKPIRLTEIGWSAAQHVCESGAWAGQKLAGVDEAAQARYLLEAFHCLAEDPYVDVAMWFNNRDPVADGRMGLLRADGSRRPAYAAFQDHARHGDRLTGSCGDFGAPTVQILAPKSDDVIGTGEPLEIRATTPDRDVLRMRFAVKGPPKEIRNFTNGGRPLDVGNASG